MQDVLKAVLMCPVWGGLDKQPLLLMSVSWSAGGGGLSGEDFCFLFGRRDLLSTPNTGRCSFLLVHFD